MTTIMAGSSGGSTDSDGNNDSGTAPQHDWFETSGARELRAASPIAYSDYVRRSSCSSYSTPALEDDRRQIELDVPRTSSSICEFILRTAVSEDDDDAGERANELAAPFLPMLRNILLAYSVRNPRVGYVQGHADVVCFLVGHINDRRDADEVFWVYASLIERVFPDDFFARAPKLHGFQVDNRLFKELVARKLVPHTPALAQIDLTLVTSLLACKWFVSLWVGHLPRTLLYRVWDVMLSSDDGAILHLLLALSFFQTATDRVLDHMASDDWDSSFLYQIILESSQHAPTTLDPRDVLRQGQTTYGLTDDAVDDMRSSLRLVAPLQRAEVAALACTTAFHVSELTQLHEEFLFARFYSKTYERHKVRGVRQAYFTSLVTREFVAWPVDICARLFQLMQPDGYGNVSFARLVELLSVMARGDDDAKAALLFAIPDVESRGELDCAGAEQLAALGDTSQTLSLGHDALQTPLLRSQFRLKLARRDNASLTRHQWLELARADCDIAALLDWHHCSNSDCQVQSPSQQSDKKTPTTPAAHVSDAPESENRHPNSADACEELTASPLRRVRLLSATMESKFALSRALVTDADADALRRNPFESHDFLDSGHAGAMQHQQLYWCQCALS